MRVFFLFPFLLAPLVSVFASSPALAAGKTEILGKFGYWTAYAMQENKQPVCYMSIMARSPKGEKAKRGDVILMITHRPGENVTDVVSYTAGMKFKPGSEAVIGVDSRQFSLFTQDDTAWSRDSATDRAVSAALRKGSNAIVTGVASNGTKISDTVNLKGSAAAYKAISKACGLSPSEGSAAKSVNKTSAKPAKRSPKKKK